MFIKKQRKYDVFKSMNSGFYINYTLQEIYHIEVRWLNQPKSWPIFLFYFLYLRLPKKTITDLS